MAPEIKKFSENLEKELNFKIEFPRNLWAAFTSVLKRNKGFKIQY